MVKTNQNKIIIYKAEKKELIEFMGDFTHETIWATQIQIAKAFNVDTRTINEHIQNIIKNKELSAILTIRKFRIVKKEGKREIKRDIKHYNLDMILSVGYRVNSKKATFFRQWATKVLKQHIIQGYSLNENRLLEVKNKFTELQSAVAFLQRQSKKELLHGQESEILNLLSDYSKTLSLLEQYDKGKLANTKSEKNKFVLKYEDCLKIITSLKKELINKKQAGSLFGQEKDKSFIGIIKNLYQTFDKKPLYPSIADKASHLLYLIIKDHPFTDGNKRTAAFLFVYFLDKSNYLFKKSGERKINDNALTALALLVAESDPQDKDVMIKIIKNLLV